MVYIIIGIVSFSLFYIFDFNKLRRINSLLNLCFAAGVIVLSYSTIKLIFYKEQDFAFSPFLSALMYALSAICFFLLIFSLFGALPFKSTYAEIDNSENKVINTGLYALCRHPGVIWFILFYIFLWLASGRNILLYAAVLWSVSDIIHVYVQDSFYFPKMLKGYKEYQKAVPFLIPTGKSVRECFNTIRKRDAA